MKYILFIVATFIFAFHSLAQVLIPSPTKMVRTGGTFSIRQKQVWVYAQGESSVYLHFFQKEALPTLTIQQTGNRKKANVCFVTDSSLEKDAYQLNISSKGIEVRAACFGGFIYAIQSLRQWVNMEKGYPEFSCVEITDSPRTQWRSFMLDSGRQFQKVSTIKKYIDMASLLKMNYFHWHLTEGLGWRIEIKQYPRLTHIGAFAGKGPEQQGFYTQETIREIVKYAADRNITVVPEIDMPGHAEAALLAYPELGCFGLPVEIPEIGFTDNIFCAGKDKTLQFLKNVLDEVCELFPSVYIHLGGDEALKGNWDKCPDCQGRIKGEKLKNSHDLQLWFSAQMANYLKGKGRKAIFWGDVVYQEGYPLPDNVVIHWWNWRGHKDLALRNALSHGYPVICGTNYYTYLNFPLTPWRGYGKDRTFDLRDVYLHNPSYMSTEDNPLILGMSSALWTDDKVTEGMIDRRLFPRILALAEQMWYKGKPENFEQFYNRVLQKKAWFEQLGFQFGPALEEETDVNYKWD